MSTKKMQYNFPSRTFKVTRAGVVFEIQPEPEGSYTVSVPALPGCISYGSTAEESKEMIKDAIACWLAVAHEQGLKITPQFESIDLSSI